MVGDVVESLLAPGKGVGWTKYSQQADAKAQSI